MIYKMSRYYRVQLERMKVNRWTFMSDFTLILSTYYHARQRPKNHKLEYIGPKTAEQINTQVTPHIWYTDIRKIGAANHRFLLAQASVQ